MLRLLLFLAALAIQPLPEARGQSTHPEEGRPLFTQRFGPADYGGLEQNWWVVQDPRGVMFAANWGQVLEYDGVDWRAHRIPNQFVRSLTVGRDGLVYVGGVGEIGVLRPDSTQTLTYESLLRYVPEEAKDFADVWTTYALTDGVYFQSFKRLLRWDGSRMRVWEAGEGRFHKGFLVDGTFYVRHEGRGLLRVEGESLVPVRGGARFAEQRVDALLPHPEADALVVARDEGLLLKRGSSYVRFATQADGYLRDQRIYQGVALSDSTYALSTTSGTVVLLDDRGRVLRLIGGESGLSPDDLVLHVAQDRQGGLWLALDRGLLRVDALPAVTLFGEPQGLRGMVVDAFSLDGTLHASTSQGLFRLRPAPADGNWLHRHARFEPVGELSQQIWFALEAGGRHLVAANAGVAEIHGGETRWVLRERAFVLSPSRNRPGILYAGLKDGLAELRQHDGAWEASGVLEGIPPGEVRSLVEHADGSLWLGLLSGGVVRAWIEGGRVVRSERFGSEHGLDGGAVVVQEIRGRLAFYTSHGVYRFEQSGGGRFTRDAELTRLALQGAPSADYLLSAPPFSNDLWVIREGQVRMYREEGGGYRDVTPPAIRFWGIPERSIFVEEQGVVWMAGEGGLLRFDPGVPTRYDAPYRALVRRVLTRDGRVLYGGAGLPSANPRVRYGSNDLRFEFAAPTFNLPEQTVYQYRLEGYDEEWSEWTDVTFKEYTNLPERHYRFHVRARNAHGVESEVGTFSYRVLPPWYRSLWAYAAYVALFALTLWGYGRWRVRAHLEELARERVVRRQLEEANARLKLANERLREADKLKDDLLANTSHELRTPLTSILGFADVLQDELEGEQQDFAAHIHRSGRRLLDTVNALLDMASLQADVLELQPEDVDLSAEVARALADMAPLAEAKGLYLHVMPEEMGVGARLDRGALGRVLTNLVGNAIKFTQEGGVTVLVDSAEEEVSLTVRDTGIGIRPEFLPHLFNAFQQASTGHGRDFEGSGLGLAITKRLVTLMGGEISVESEDGEGATFRVRLPRWPRGRGERAGSRGGRAPSSLVGRRILLLEDPSRPQRHLCALLSPLCELDVAVGRDAGVERASSQAYDAILIDAHLSEGAADALRALRNLPGTAEAPAVAVAAFTLSSDRERFLAEGFDDHIDRPITRTRLTSQLEGLVEGGGAAARVVG